jgi:hypothetical protein
LSRLRDYPDELMMMSTDGQKWRIICQK